MAAAAVAFATLAAMPVSVAGSCPLEIVGTWRLVDSTETRATLLSFMPDGLANVLNGAGEQGPGDIVAQVRYRLEPGQDARRIDFDARRGNDIFPAGRTSWQITAHSDSSFTSRDTRSIDGALDAWQRVQTHRYFLTFAARSAPPAGESAAFVMWTTLDGRRLTLDGLGVVQQGEAARFGRIPESLAREFAAQGDPSRDVMMRIELSEAEYRRTQAVLRAWRIAARGPEKDPNQQAAQFIEATVDSINRCRPRIQLSDGRIGTQPAAQPAHRPVDLVHMIRKANERRHLPDKAFPAFWKPAELS